MSKNKRDRPGKRGSLKRKLSNVLIIILAVAAFGSLVSMSSWLDIGGSSGSSGSKPSRPDNSVVVTPPDTDSGTEETPTPDEPVATVITNALISHKEDGSFGKDTAGSFSYSLENKNLHFSGAVEDITGSEWISFLFAPEYVAYVDGINLEDYSQVKIELGMNNDAYSHVLGCNFYIVGRAEDATGVKSTTSVINVAAASGVSDISLRVGEETYTATSHKIVYLIDVNKEATEASRLRVYIDDVLSVDSNELFTKPVAQLTELRFTYFNSVTEIADLGLTGLTVTVYE